MKWKRNTGFDQIEDRRGQAVGGGGGGMGGAGMGALLVPLVGALLNGKAGKGGLILIVVIVAVVLFSGVLGGGGGVSGLGALTGGGAPAGPVGTLDARNDTDQQLAYIVSNIQAYWGKTFSDVGRDYPETVLVYFEGATNSSCGPASSDTGPFYCPADQKVHLDIGFFDQLKSQFGAKGGDFAIAYVVAHEFGHHIQTVLGISEQVQQLSGRDPSQANPLSVKQELQADCFAGAWAHSAASDLEPGDIEEALDAAAAVGDDRIQQATTGRVNPESWTHGSAAAREQWFSTGYDSGDPERCDTFAQ